MRSDARLEKYKKMRRTLTAAHKAQRRADTELNDSSEFSASDHFVVHPAGVSRFPVADRLCVNFAHRLS